MLQYVEFLAEQRYKNAEMTATLTLFELPNLFVLLDRVEQAGNAAATIELATALHALLGNLDRPRLVARVDRARDAAAAALHEDWGHPAFEAERMRIEHPGRVSAGGIFRRQDGSKREHEEQPSGIPRDHQDEPVAFEEVLLLRISVEFVLVKNVGSRADHDPQSAQTCPPTKLEILAVHEELFGEAAEVGEHVGA